MTCDQSNGSFGHEQADGCVCEPSHGASFRGPEKDIRDSKGPGGEMRQLFHDAFVG